MDHSKGIAEVMQYCSDTSCIYITPAIYPHIISGDKTLNTEEKAVKKYLETVLTGNNKTGPRVFRVADAKLLYKIFYRSNDRRYAISISSFCPNDNQLIQHDFRGTKNDDNISSIGLNIKAGLCGLCPETYNIILAGDVEDIAMKNIPAYSEAFNQPSYIKIPHHSSSSAKYMINLLRNEDLTNLQVATTSIYERFDLPDENVLCEYMQTLNSNTQIYVTKNIKQKENNKHKYGLIRTIFDICDDLGQSVYCQVEGDATLWKV